MIGLCEMDVKVGKWQAKLPFYVMDHGVHPILVYLSLKALGVRVDCVRDCLIRSDGEVFFCNSNKEEKKRVEKTKKAEMCSHHMCIWCSHKKLRGLRLCQKVTCS